MASMTESKDKVADTTREVVDESIERIRKAAEEAEELVRNSSRRMRRKSSEAYEGVADLVQEYPIATIAIALAAGALVASLLRR